MPTIPAYATTKAALHAFGQSLAVALGDRGIAVTAAAPGVIDAGMALPLLDGPAGESLRAQSPLGRVGTAEEVAEAVLYLASPQAEFASGTVRLVGTVDGHGTDSLAQRKAVQGVEFDGTSPNFVAKSSSLAEKVE